VRTLLGWLLLFGLAALAGLGTARWRADARTRGESLTKVQDDEKPGVPARVLIGQYSGAAPLRVEEVVSPIAPVVLHEESAPPPAPLMVTVHPGSTLSKLCQEYYVEVGRPPLSKVVDAVALWNGLANPNDLRAGQVLELPPLSSLFP
jgi:LysM repeat protein